MLAKRESFEGVRMRLVSFSVQNFRAYRDKKTVSVADLTSIIGRNDIGKSTLLEALEIFFNNKTISIEKGDVNVHSGDEFIEISCTFDELPSELTIDERSATTLETEYLTNLDGNFEVVKRFNCGLKTPKAEIFAIAKHPAHEKVKDLLKLKNNDLKRRARELEIPEGQVDERSNAALREAIREVVGDFDTNIVRVPLNEQDGKIVWEQVEKLLPVFALFQADRPSMDDDPEVADPMKIAVQQAVQQHQEDLENFKRKVRESALGVANRTLAKLQEMDESLADELFADFKTEPKWEGFKLTLSGRNDIPINKRGSGVRRLILLNFFRAEVERRRAEQNVSGIIFAIEEPESSQHPDNQVMLVRTLLKLSEEESTQVLMTTHVPAVAAVIPTDSVRFLQRDTEGNVQIQQGEDGAYERVAESLGLLPDKRAQVAICVEGPKDVAFLTAAARLLRQDDATLPDLETDHRVAFVPIGGGNMRHWVNKRYLKTAGLIEVHIYDCDDKDNPPYKTYANEVIRRGNHDTAFLTSKREAENYIHPRAIREALELYADVEFGDWDDVPEIVAQQVHLDSESETPWGELNDKKRRKKIDNAKSRLNFEAAHVMTLAELRE